MAKEKTLVEETFIQMKNLEEAVAENAKGILASTMKQEIKDLVKESLFEQEEDEDEVETDTDVEDSETEFDTDVDNLEDDETEFSMEDPMDDSEPIDLTDPSVSNDEVLKVFQLMGPEDEVIVVKNTDGNINLKDNQTNKEYMIVQESDDDYFGEGNYSEMDEMDEYLNEFEDEYEDDYSDNSYGNSDLDDKLNDAFSEMDEMNNFDAEQIDEVIYELEMDEEEEPPIDFELEEMVGVDYMSDELGESSSLSSNRGLEKLIEKHSLDQILALFDNDEDSIDELMSTFEPLGITSYDELVDYKGEDSEYEDEDDDFGFAQHDGDFGGDDSEFDDEDFVEDEEELDLREFDDLEEDETW